MHTDNLSWDEAARLERQEELDQAEAAYEAAERAFYDCEECEESAMMAAMVLADQRREDARQALREHGEYIELVAAVRRSIVRRVLAAGGSL